MTAIIHFKFTNVHQVFTNVAMGRSLFFPAQLLSVRQQIPRRFEGDTQSGLE